MKKMGSFFLFLRTEMLCKFWGVLEGKRMGDFIGI